MDLPIDVTEGVRTALAVGGPVVALESTLIAHGLPWPLNYETALAAEAAVRRSGGIPATIAVLAGRLKVGLTAEQVRAVAQSNDVIKAGRRELAWAVATQRTAATTVAGTLAVAARVGIHVFATGGIGGVHRGAETSFDVSADLWELARCPVAVVCSGAKGILNLPATLEVLESYAVPVVGYRTGEFPAFYVRSSGLPVAMRVETAAEAARLFAIHRRFNQSSMIFGQPVAQGLSQHEFDALLYQAERAAVEAGITGARVTPFLLAHLATASAGRTLAINRDLIVANAELAGAVAACLAQLGKDNPSSVG